MKASEFITEKWSQKYKSSINCSHPKGFSQKAHCAGKKKHTESYQVMEHVCPDCGMCQTHGDMSLNEIKKGQKDSNGFSSCWKGYHAAGTKKGKNGGQVRNCVPNKSQGVAEGTENNNPIAQKIFFARSNKTPKGWSYDHVGFITQDGKQIQMSGHKGNDVYVTNAVTDDPEFPKQNIKIVSLSKPVSVPTTNSVGAENCGTFVANVLQANGIKGIDTQKIYSVFKKPQEQGVAEGAGAKQAAIAIAKKASGKYTKDGKRLKEGSLADAAKHVKKGALHKQEGIPADKKIGANKLKSLKAHGTPLEKKRANFALNIQGIKENTSQIYRKQ